MAADSNKIRPWFPAAAFALALFIAMYLTFTVNPPHISLFLDSSTGTYGIPPRNLDAGAVYLVRVKRNLIVFLPDCFCFILEKCLLFS